MSDQERAVIASRLREARDYLGLSQQDVAQATNLSRSAVSLIESGQRGVDTVELVALARLYQRSVAYFTGEEEAALPTDVQALARQASQLSVKDRSELLRFSEFLMQRSQETSDDDNKT
ncbi:MAG: helix-turn-helix transcriptional regulator [Sulfuritalea sp.]|nr:helix-turn-helix transcriptional regulator [Sulfuritalea sp.]MDP1983284.1 helix-turn-helix transcriptional regulator [Sulfuritalea sp.]